MRFLLPCPLFCNSEKANQSASNPIPLEPSTSLSSQPSLPSVPSLASPSQHRHERASSVNHRCIATLKGHKSYVFSLALAGKQLYSGTYDEEIRVWSRDSRYHDENSANNNVVATGNGAVKSLVVSGDKLFSAHQDHKIRVWKIDSESYPRKHHCLATLPTVGDRFLTLFSAKNYVQVRRHKVCTWVHHVDTVSALALSEDGSLLYSASWDRTFKVWRTSDFRCLESTANAHDDAINALTLSKDGYVYTGSADKKIKVWKIRHAEYRRGKKKHSSVATLEKHRSGVNALALNSDGSVLYSGACDRSIVVWERDGSGSNGRHMAVVGALRGHTMAILCLATVSDLLCSGSADKTIRVWRRSALDKSYACLAVLQGHTKPVKCLAASVEGGNEDESISAPGNSYLVYSGSLDCSVKVWKVCVPFF